jgi:SMODS and SLOG-associating 2TM effector domain family 4
LSAYTKDFDFGELAQRHTNTANRLWAIREAYFSLLTDLAAGLVSLEEIIRQRDQLQHRLEDVHKGAPRTNPRAYTAAQKALKIDEELTFGDHEIDAFLPTELRRSARASRTNGNAGLSQEQRQIPA